LNITMNRAELLSTAQRAAAIAPADSPLESLRGTLLEANAATGTLTLTATNLETALEQSLSCPTAEDDALVVDAKLLAGMLERLPGDTVELKRRPGVPVLSLLGGQTADLAYDVLTKGMDGMEDYYLLEGGIITVNTETAAALNIDYTVFQDMGTVAEVQTTED